MRFHNDRRFILGISQSILVGVSSQDLLNSYHQLVSVNNHFDYIIMN